MKPIKHIIIQFAFVFFLLSSSLAKAQIIFKEDFGKSIVRLPSQYVPQSGLDSNLSGSFSHGSKFYKFANIATDYVGENQNSNVIDNGYYSVIAPSKIYDNLPANKPTWANWWSNIPNHTDNSSDGAVLVINGGTVLNQYYRRALTLERGKTYKISTWLYSTTGTNVGVKFEAQNISTEAVLGASTNLLVTQANQWQEKSWTFTVPDNDNCSNVAISLRNIVSTDSGNDFYVDDITLEQVTGQTGTLISCSQSPSFDSIIKARNDSFRPTNNNGGTFNILGNDSINDLNGFILSGAKTNASISKIGLWPTGYNINTFGQLVIAPNATPLSAPLIYQICTSLGICSTAQIDVKVDIPFKGNPDTYSWVSSFPKTYDILSNDTYDNGTPGTGFIFSGANQNMSISTKGAWPANITLTPNGQIRATSGIVSPISDLYYTLCNTTGTCQDVRVTFNNIDPGSISTNNTIVCDGSEITVVSKSIAPNGGIFDLNLYNYRWQGSYDNGLTWTYLSDETINITSLTTTVSEGTFMVRRQVRKAVIGILLGDFAYTDPVKIQVIKNHISYNGGNNFVVTKGSSVSFPTVITSYPSTVTIKDENGITVTQGQIIPFNTAGIFMYTVTATGTAIPNCQETSSITVQVYDLSNCNETSEKVFATSQTWNTATLLGIALGGITEEAKAVDGDMSTYSEINIGLGLLGLGTTWQNLNFGHKIDKGTPVKIKMGQDYSLLQVAGGITITAVDQNNNRIGPLVGVGEGALLDLLVGDNVFEFSFIPRGNDGKPIDYYGVRVNLGSVLAVINKAKVYGAYYEKKKITDGSCTLTPVTAGGATKPADYIGTVKLNSFVDDVLWGVEDIGLGVATALSSVVHPYLAVDDNMDSYAIFSRAVAALNRQKLNIKLRHIARPGDEIRIIMGGFEVPLLDVSLLTAFRVQRYMGNVKVGPEVPGSQFKLLDLNLLGLLGSTGKRKALIVSSINQPFDHIEISYTSVVQVSLLGDYTYIYDVSIMPKMVFEGQDPNNPNTATALCAADYLKVTKNDICTTYDISFAYANKSGDTITSFTEIINSAILKVNETPNSIAYEFNSLYGAYTENLYLKVQTKRQGCNYGDPQYLKVNLRNCIDPIVNPVLKTTVRD